MSVTCDVSHVSGRPYVGSDGQSPAVLIARQSFTLVLVGGALNPGRNAEAAQMGVSNKNRRLYVTMQYISAHAFRARGGYRLFEVERRSGSDGSLSESQTLRN